MKMLVLCPQCDQMMKWYNDGWGTGAWFCFDCPEVIYPGMASKGDMIVVNANGSSRFPLFSIISCPFIESFIDTVRSWNEILQRMTEELQDWPKAPPYDPNRSLKCRVCLQPLSIHKVDDQGAVALLECPTGDRRVIVFVSPT